MAGHRSRFLIQAAFRGGTGQSGGLAMALRIGTTMPCSEQRALRASRNATTGRLQWGQTVWMGRESVIANTPRKSALSSISAIHTALVPSVQQKLLSSNIGSVKDTVARAILGFEHQFTGAALGGSARRPIYGG
jgi:hypothetical protein